jgi:hypothetical protein
MATRTRRATSPTPITTSRAALGRSCSRHAKACWMTGLPYSTCSSTIGGAWFTLLCALLSLCSLHDTQSALVFAYVSVARINA